MPSDFRRRRSRSPRYRRRSRSHSPKANRKMSDSRGSPKKSTRRQSRSSSRGSRSRSYRRRSRSRSRGSPNRINRRRSRSHSRGLCNRSGSRERSKVTKQREQKGKNLSPNKRSRSRSLERKSVTSKPVKDDAPQVNKEKYEWSSKKMEITPAGVRDPQPLSHKTPSPENLDDILLSAQPVLGLKQQPSLFQRYAKQDINVVSIHSKGKLLRSRSEIDDDGSTKDFAAIEVIEIIHKVSKVKDPKPIFERDEIINFVPQEVETKVIRLLPSQEEFKIFETHFSRKESQSSDKESKYRSREDKSRLKHSPTRDLRSRKETRNLDLTRAPERKRHAVTDSDLLGDGALSNSSLSSSSRVNRDGLQKKSVRDRLGSPSNRPDRYGVSTDVWERSDLRHNISHKLRESELKPAPPLVKDYGHKSLSMSSLSRYKAEDFSRRPDKGKIDVTAFDPTVVPRGGRYDEHDDRDRKFSGGSGNRGRGGRWRGGNRRREEGRYRDGRGYQRDNHRDEGHSKTESDFTWKHDKFDELEDELERRVEPSSTTN